MLCSKMHMREKLEGGESTELEDEGEREREQKRAWLCRVEARSLRVSQYVRT